MEAIKQKMPVIIMIIGVILLCLFLSMTGGGQSATEPDSRALSERYPVINLSINIAEIVRNPIKNF